MDCVAVGAAVAGGAHGALGAAEALGALDEAAVDDWPIAQANDQTAFDDGGWNDGSVHLFS